MHARGIHVTKQKRAVTTYIPVYAQQLLVSVSINVCTLNERVCSYVYVE